MAEEEDKTRESVRERVIDKQKKALNSSESGYAILTLALTIGFFGSSAVLMPSDQSVTGMFSGQEEILKPQMYTDSIRDREVSDNRVSFVIDSWIFNPNFAGAEIEQIDYRILLDNQLVKTGQVSGSTRIPPERIRMSAVKYELDVSGLPESEKLSLEEGNFEQDIRVEGIIEFDIAGQEATREFGSDVST